MSVETPPQGSFLTVSAPSQKEKEELGMREWPGFLNKDSNFVETGLESGKVRFVQKGRGKVVATAAASADSAVSQSVPLEPGVFITVDKACDLAWTVDEPLLLLTPEFEQTGIYIAFVASVIAAFCFVFANLGSPSGT